MADSAASGDAWSAEATAATAAATAAAALAASKRSRSWRPSWQNLGSEGGVAGYETYGGRI